MPNSLRLSVSASLLCVVLLTPACHIARPAALAAASAPQRVFASPDEAVKALLAATQAGDRTTLREIFGPESHELLSGDRVEDANERDAFTEELATDCHIAYEGGDKAVLEIGTPAWPFPIPLVKQDGRWHFDTAAGKDEIINRRVGENELMAIDVCREYVAAQREYASRDRDGSGVLKYAKKMKSTPGKKDGLFWEPAPGEEESPFGPLVASARTDGYGPGKTGEKPRPFYGYLFRIIPVQTPPATAGHSSDTPADGLAAGFALIAHPVRWGDSGVMTFIVNQDGRVLERNLGEKTSQLVGEIMAYDPDGNWTPVAPNGAARTALGR